MANICGYVPKNLLFIAYKVMKDIYQIACSNLLGAISASDALEHLSEVRYAA